MEDFSSRWIGLKELTSLSVGDKTIIFNDLQVGDHLLFLYESCADITYSFLSFTKAGLTKNELCLYAFDKEGSKVNFDDDFLKSIPG